MRGSSFHGYHTVEGKQLHGMEDYVVAEMRRVGDYKKLGLYAMNNKLSFTN